MYQAPAEINIVRVRKGDVGARERVVGLAGFGPTIFGHSLRVSGLLIVLLPTFG